jgi:hypothetical protein
MKQQEQNTQRVLARVTSQSALRHTVRGGSGTVVVYGSASGRTDITNLDGDNDGPENRDI